MSRLLIEIAAAVAALVAFALYEQHRGAEKCRAKNDEVTQAQEVTNARAEGGQTVEVRHQGEVYRETISQPVSDAPVVRVCAPRPERVPDARPAGPVDHGETELSRDNSELPAAIEWDSAGVVRAGRDADAQVRALQDYIENVCLKPASAF